MLIAPTLSYLYMQVYVIGQGGELGWGFAVSLSVQALV
jgi:hypothetical protein